MLIDVPLHSEEGISIKDVRNTEKELRGYRKSIIKILRVQNPGLLRIFQAKKASMESTNANEQGANEKLLWHGTSVDTVEKITEQGFNRSFCGKNATAYGNGVYFATSILYSARRTYAAPDHKGIQTIFLAKVLIGQYSQGCSGLRVPPVKHGNVLYDSVVDCVSAPQMHVVFSDHQAYPAYIVKLK
mmetsp:Transcript_34155/g.53397  ORF Transcript_34155/g.53397 Transcript_34155/m.53397 type:complete len:187 (+) Transcript_34155:232-792(+)